MVKKHLIRCIVCIGLAFPLTGLAYRADTTVLNLKDWNFNDSETVPLSGNWEFYWSTFLSSKGSRRALHPEQIAVPGAWNRQLSYPALGFATYRRTLLMPEQNVGLAIYFPIVNSAARVWINGNKVAETGKVSKTEDDYRPQLTRLLVEIPSNSTELEIIVEVSNFTHFNGGIASEPQLGKISALLSGIEKTQSIENFFAGSLVAMFIYQFVLYFLFPRGKPYLWLSLICLGVALRAMIAHGGSFMLPNLFPFVSWEAWKKVEFLSVYAIAAIFPLYIFHLFRDHAPSWPVKYFVGVSGALCLTVVMTPQYLYGQLLDISHLALLAAFIYAIYSVGRAWKAGSYDAKIIFFGVLASFPFILVEMLKNSLLFPLGVQWMYLVEIGVLVFLLFQVYLLAHHYARSFRNLESMNENLEKMVNDRSAQLIVANQVKDRLLTVLSHDIKGPLNSLRGILRIYNSGAIGVQEFKTYAALIEGDVTKTGLMVDNILQWTAGQLRGVTINLTKFNLNELLNENIDLLRTIMANKHITLENHLTDMDWVQFDRDILNLSFRNLISNAIKFSFEGGKIIVRCICSEDFAIVQVADFGLGMSEDQLQSLKVGTAQSSPGTAHEKGTGLGLSFCREYLQYAGGQLKVESVLGQGSTFSIWIPREEPELKWTEVREWELNLIR